MIAGPQQSRSGGAWVRGGESSSSEHLFDTALSALVGPSALWWELSALVEPEEEYGDPSSTPPVGLSVGEVPGRGSPCTAQDSRRGTYRKGSPEEGRTRTARQMRDGPGGVARRGAYRKGSSREPTSHWCTTQLSGLQQSLPCCPVPRCRSRAVRSPFVGVSCGAGGVGDSTEFSARPVHRIPHRAGPPATTGPHEPAAPDDRILSRRGRGLASSHGPCHRGRHATGAEALPVRVPARRRPPPFPVGAFVDLDDLQVESGSGGI